MAYLGTCMMGETGFNRFTIIIRSTELMTLEFETLVHVLEVQRNENGCKLRGPKLGVIGMLVGS